MAPLLKDRPRKYQPPSLDLFRRLFFKENKTLREIADILGLPRPTLRHWFIRHRGEFEELRFLSKGEKSEVRRRRYRPRGSLRQLSVEVFDQLYFKEGKSLQQVADIFGTRRQAVHDWFRRHKSQFAERLRSVGKKSKYTPIVGFFSSWSPEMAYVLGVLATDGNVRHNTVRLSLTDLELVEKVRSLMGSDHPIRQVAPKGYSRKVQYHLQISSIELAATLTKLGITPRKSRSLAFPEMPKDCIRHFLRGCWDGDGSFLLEPPKLLVPRLSLPKLLVRRRRGVPRGVPRMILAASFVSGSRKFITGISTCLKEVGIKPGRKRMKQSRTNIMSDPGTLAVYMRKRNGRVVCYQLKVPNRMALALGRFLYEGVPASMYLTRKYEIYRKAAAQSGR